MGAKRRLAAATAVRVLPWIALAAYAGAMIRGKGASPGRRPAKPGLSKPEQGTPAGFEAEEPGRGRSAPSVHKIPPRGWRDVAWRVWQEVGKDRLPVVAGGVTFYSLLALFPGLGAFVALYGLVADVAAVSEQIGRLRLVLPSDVVDLLGEQMLRIATAHDAGLSLTFVGSLLFAVWSAAAGVNALFDGMNIAYGEAEKRNWLRRRLTVLAFTAGGVLMLTVLTTCLIALPLRLKGYGFGPADFWWVPFSWLLALAAMSGFFAALYRFGPSRARARWSWVWPGSVAAAAGWLIVSAGFTIYVGRFANYQDAYGPLGTVIAFMVWIWLTALIILLGAELNAEIEHQTAVDTTTGVPAPMGERGAAMADTVGERFKGLFHRKQGPKKVWTTMRSTKA